MCVCCSSVAVACALLFLVSLCPRVVVQCVFVLLHVSVSVRIDPEIAASARAQTRDMQTALHRNPWSMQACEHAVDPTMPFGARLLQGISLFELADEVVKMRSACLQRLFCGTLV